jgi:hypothetical protein
MERIESTTTPVTAPANIGTKEGFDECFAPAVDEETEAMAPALYIVDVDEGVVTVDVIEIDACEGKGVAVTVAIVPAELGDAELEEEAKLENAELDDNWLDEDEKLESGQPPSQASTEQQPWKPPSGAPHA